ncbi:hypothetical protein CVT26_005986 [Gymnopilus dilepis]|uniref:Ribonuclease H1 N-terminal domain-containing protein n=1 Tax=Gymnopilus dilepis TaxID=231916 RepID=A0A409WYY9_9AGAR|nr:hypothetical protein CVT26_005986 [Gymnopilus dilepis]
MDTSSSKLPTSPSTADGGLASCLRQLNVSLRDVQSGELVLENTLAYRSLIVHGTAIDRLNVVLDRDVRVTEAVDMPTTQRSSTDNDEPVLVEAPACTNTDDHRWYAVIVGREPGVFYSTGTVINANVHGIPNSRPVCFPSKEEAQAAFDKALDAHEVQRVELVLNRTTLLRKDFE